MALGGREDDPCPPDVLLRAVAVGHDRPQSGAVGAAHLKTDPSGHPHHIAAGQPREHYDCVNPLGGMSSMRMMWDTVAAQDEEARRLRGQYCFQPMMRPDEMRQAFAAQDLVNVEQTSLLIRMEYASFADYWSPISAGEGPLGKSTRRGGPKSTRRSGPPTRPGSPTARAPSRRWPGPAGAWSRNWAEAPPEACDSWTAG